jgi:hypothetical protein
MRRALLVGFALALALAALPSHARDRGADGRFEKRTSSHFVLLQDVDIDESGGFHGSRRFEQEVLDELEGAYSRLGELMGLRPRRPITVMVYDPGLFDAHFSGLVRFALAGFYRGVIRVRGNVTMTPSLSRVLHHELVHAAFDMEAPSVALPGWVNEGLAEWFEARAWGKRRLSGREQSFLARGRDAGVLPSLAQLSTPGFGRLDSEGADQAYVKSYAAFAYLARTHGERSIPQFVEVLLRTRRLDRALANVYGTDLDALEADLSASW